MIHLEYLLFCGILGARGLLYRTDRTAQMPIIDTHQHLWDLSRFRLPWVNPGTVLARSFLVCDYHRAAGGLEVIKTVYIEGDVDPAQRQDEADFVVAACRQPETGVVAGVVSGRPATDDFASYVSQFKDSPCIKGIRQVLHVARTPAGYCQDAMFVDGVRRLGESGLRFDLCVRPGELHDAAQLIDACPVTQFILDHCGNPPVHNPDGTTPDRTQWQRDLEALARRENVVCKVSGLVNTAKCSAWSAVDLAPIVNHTLDVFGPDRVMFGGDWPVCTRVAPLAEWVSALRTVVSSRPKEHQRKLFHDNAVRVYDLN